MCALIKMKKHTGCNFYFLFSFCFVFSTFMHGFALLPFLLLVFRFSSWFVPLFGYPIYGRRVGGQASVAKERG